MSAPGTTTKPASPWLPATFRALRHRNYRLYFLGQIVSLVGTFVQNTALAWLAYEMTLESKWPALVVAAQILPGFFLGPLGGVLADRFPKRTLIVVSQAAFGLLALVLAGVVISGVATPWHLLAIALVSGLVGAIDLPARLAFVMEMVGRDDLVNAVALNSLLFNVARAVGPAAATSLMLLFSPGFCFLINGLSYFAVLAALVAMNLPPHPVRPRERGGPSLLAGFRYLLDHPSLTLLIAMAGVMSLCGWPFLSLLPKFADLGLDIDKEGYGLLVSATGVGALVAALVVATYGSVSRRRWFLLSGVGLTVLALVGLSQARDAVGAAVYCALIGGGLISFMATSQAVVQLSAADDVRGRVLGIWSMVISGGLPAGGLIAGYAADVWGEPAVIGWQGVICGFMALTLLGLRWFLKWGKTQEIP